MFWPNPDMWSSRRSNMAIETHPAKVGCVVEQGRRIWRTASRAVSAASAKSASFMPTGTAFGAPVDIGARVFKGFVIGHHDGVSVHAPIDGFLRGIARDATFAPYGVKLVELGPRGRAATWTGTDQRGRAIAEAAVKAIQTGVVRQRALGAAEAARD